MQAHEFTSKWINLSDEVDYDIANSDILVMGIDTENGVKYSIKDFIHETDENGIETIWLELEEY